MAGFLIALNDGTDEKGRNLRAGDTILVEDLAAKKRKCEKTRELIKLREQCKLPQGKIWDIRFHLVSCDSCKRWKEERESTRHFREQNVPPSAIA